MPGLALSKDAQYWINTDFGWTTTEQAVNQDVNFKDFKSVRCQNIWERTLRSTTTNGKTANDAMESGIVFPDLMLLDLVKIFHPDLAASKAHAMEYYQPILPPHPTSAIARSLVP